MNSMATRVEAIATRNKKLQETRASLLVTRHLTSSKKLVGWRPSLLVAGIQLFAGNLLLRSNNSNWGERENGRLGDRKWIGCWEGAAL